MRVLDKKQLLSILSVGYALAAQIHVHASANAHM